MSEICDPRSVLSTFSQFTYMIFIYSYSDIFTIIGYMTNSQLTCHLCTWLGSSVDKALHRYHKVKGSNPVEA